MIQGVSGASAPSSHTIGSTSRTQWAGRVGWLTALAILAIAAVNVAGVWGIAVTRRGVVEEADKLFRVETAARARTIESLLASTRADLAFLASSPAFLRLETELFSSDPREVRWRRLAVEGALLLFLRGHPEVSHLSLASSSGDPLVAAGRRGGVPVLWKPRTMGEATADVGDPSGRDRSELSGKLEVAVGSDSQRNPAQLLATLDEAALLGHAREAEEGSRSCELADRNGRIIASETQNREGLSAGTNAPGRADDATATAEAEIRTEGWTAPSPWRLTCVRRDQPTAALLEPIARRYRLTLILNIAVMGLTVLLGSFAIQQARRRQSLEATAREEARVRELERQLFHAERLSTVGRLAAGIAHEINNPLEGMSNYLQLAKDDLARADAASARGRLEGVAEGLRRAAGIVRLVLAHADPASPPNTLLDLNAVVGQTVDFVRSRREFERIEFSLALSKEPVEVRGSSVALGQVFLNLLINACEAQPRGGEVQIATTRKGDGVEGEIADRGPGVPAADLQRVFEPFFTTKQSTGLGLSICHSIVRQHGGDLTAEPRPGGGAVFRVRLPVAQSVEAVQEARSDA